MPNGVAALEQTIARLQSARADAEAVLARGSDQADLLVQQHFLEGLEHIVPSGPPVTASPQEEPWPSLNEAAYHGLAGDVVRMFEPHTEADPVALLASFLAEVGAMLNRGPHLILDGSFHPLLFWPVLVGQSSKSRKGTTDKRISNLMKLADETWTRGDGKGTLSSGEGLAFAVRDPEQREETTKEKGKAPDPGIEDKRLFLVQSEFGAVLKVMAREGNSLSGVLRDAWDGQDLAPMTKSNRVRATNPHIGIVGHVTQDELCRNLNSTEASNGFANRFVWLRVKRSQELPFPSAPDSHDLMQLASVVGMAIQRGRSLSEISFTASARDAWRAVYHDLSADRPGLSGVLLGRAEAQVMRLAGLYTVLDGKKHIDVSHLSAALALWEYAETSTRQIFGDDTGDHIADTILRALQAGEGLDDSRISGLFGRNVPAARLEQSKKLLEAKGLAHPEVRMSHEGGRPSRIWRRGTKKTN